MSFLSGLRHRIRELVQPAAVERELDEELQDHFEHERARQINRGVSLDGAERAARIRTGRLDLAMEAVASERTGHLLGDLARDLRSDRLPPSLVDAARRRDFRECRRSERDQPQEQYDWSPIRRLSG